MNTNLSCVVSPDVKDTVWLLARWCNVTPSKMAERLIKDGLKTLPLAIEFSNSGRNRVRSSLYPTKIEPELQRPTGSEH